VARLAGELVLGLRGTVRRAEGIYGQRASRRSDRWQRKRRRRDGADGRRDGVARNSGELKQTARCTRTATNDVVDFLAPLRVSGAAPRRRSGYDGEKSKAAARVRASGIGGARRLGGQGTGVSGRRSRRRRRP
jgi:hypothetical protein